MGREGHETTVVCSSIALLQERFRQLQRVKEMRVQRELLRMFIEPNDNHNKNIINEQFINPNNSPNTANVYEPSRLFFHPDLIFPRRSTSQKLSLSVWPTFYGGFDDDQMPVFSNLWPPSKTMSTFKDSSNKSGDSDEFHETDVDTSLHL